MKKVALVVDDDDFFRKMLPLLLEEQQYEVEAVDGPQKVLDIIAQRRFDVIFTDYQMPGMNGIELAKIVRERSPGSRIILMTGSAAANLFQHSQADAYLQKPFSAEDLREALGDSTKRCKG